MHNDKELKFVYDKSTRGGAGRGGAGVRPWTLSLQQETHEIRENPDIFFFGGESGGGV